MASASSPNPTRLFPLKLFYLFSETPISYTVNHFTGLFFVYSDLKWKTETLLIHGEQYHLGAAHSPTPLLCKRGEIRMTIVLLHCYF